MTDPLEFLPRTGPVDPWRFLVAAAATPLLIGVGGIFLVVPTFAVIWGIWAYLILGLPCFWFAIRTFPGAVAQRDVAPFVVAGFIANLGTFPLYLLIRSLEGGFRARDADEHALFVALFGTIFAPLHGLVFGWLYRPRRPGTGDAASEPDFIRSLKAS